MRNDITLAKTAPDRADGAEYLARSRTVSGHRGTRIGCAILSVVPVDPLYLQAIFYRRENFSRPNGREGALGPAMAGSFCCNAIETAGRMAMKF